MQQLGELGLGQLHEQGDLLCWALVVVQAECIHAHTANAQVQAPLQGVKQLYKQACKLTSLLIMLMCFRSHATICLAQNPCRGLLCIQQRHACVHMVTSQLPAPSEAWTRMHAAHAIKEILRMQEMLRMHVASS